MRTFTLALDLCNLAEAFDDVGRLLSDSLDGDTELPEELPGETGRVANTAPSCVRYIAFILDGSVEHVVHV